VGAGKIMQTDSVTPPTCSATFADSEYQGGCQLHQQVRIQRNGYTRSQTFATGRHRWSKPDRPAHLVPPILQYNPAKAATSFTRATHGAIWLSR
jgi:hypothetical protein